MQGSLSVFARVLDSATIPMDMINLSCGAFLCTASSVRACRVLGCKTDILCVSDGYSRKVLSCRVLPSNKDSAVILAEYLVSEAHMRS